MPNTKTYEEQSNVDNGTNWFPSSEDYRIESEIPMPTKSVISEIVRFQTERQLDQQPYDELNEATNITEEVLESLLYDVPKHERENLRYEVILLIQKLKSSNVISLLPSAQKDTIEKCNDLKADAFFDMITFAVGALLKLGYSPERVIEEGSKEINSRKGEIVNGKFTKYTEGEKGYVKPYVANYSTCKLNPKETK